MRIKTVLVGILAVAAAVLYVRLKASESPEPALATVLLEGVPHVRQKPDFCGEACAAMWLGKLGEKHDQDDVFDISGLDPALGRGLHTRELAAALQRIGFETGEVWHKVAAEIGAVEALWRDLHADLVRGVPSIVCMRYDESPDTTEHFRLVLGYDAGKDEVVYHEPALDKGAYRRMDRA
ncbi:MAG: C39 family peptidase, partial [Planctomycetota bacterium]